MTISSPSDPRWYIDTRVTPTMTPLEQDVFGKILIPDRIMVGNGTRLHISRQGHVYLYPVDLNYFAKHNMYHYYLRGFYQVTQDHNCY